MEEIETVLKVDLGILTISEAMQKVQSYLKSNKDYELQFTDKRTLAVHKIIHRYESPMTKVDSEGLKWQRIG